jgi:uncharacterized protein YkwD
MRRTIHAIRPGLLALAGLLAATGCDTPGPAAQPEPRMDAAPAPAAADRQLARAVLAQANQARRQSGVAQLRADRTLDGVAEAFARELARRGELSHESTVSTRRTLADRLRAAQARVGASAQNLGRSVEAEGLLPAQIVVGWMREPGAKAALVHPDFAMAGTGVARAEDGTWYIVQVYAAPRELSGVEGLPQP